MLMATATQTRSTARTELRRANLEIAVHRLLGDGARLMRRIVSRCLERRLVRGIFLAIVAVMSMNFSPSPLVAQERELFDNDLKALFKKRELLQSDDALVRLMKARYNALAERHTQLMDRVVAGRESGWWLLQNSIRLCEAGLELDHGTPDEIKHIENRVKLAKEVERWVQSEFAAGKSRATDVLWAVADVKDAEIALLKFKRANEARVKFR